LQEKLAFGSITNKEMALKMAALRTAFYLLPDKTFSKVP